MILDFDLTKVIVERLTKKDEVIEVIIMIDKYKLKLRKNSKLLMTGI